MQVKTKETDNSNRTARLNIYAKYIEFKETFTEKGAFELGLEA